jgi:nucleotide-binding universal stress UspA family protein
MYKTVLIPVDLSVPAEAQRLMLAAKTVTAEWGCALHVASVIPTVGMAIVGSYMDDDFEKRSRAAVEAQLAEAVSLAGIDAKQHVLTGTVYDGVIGLADQIKADLIIMGAHQPELRDYLLGSNAARVVRHSKQSVLVIRDT